MYRLVLLLALLGPLDLLACPSCRDAVTQTSATEEADQLHEAQSYNRSIYLMLAVPYLAVGLVGFCVYRGLRTRAESP